MRWAAAWAQAVASVSSYTGRTAARREGSKDAVCPPGQGGPRDAAAQLCLTVARRRAGLPPRGGAPPGAGLLGAGLPASASGPGPSAQTRSAKKVYPNSATSCLLSFTHSCIHLFIQSLRNSCSECEHLLYAPPFPTLQGKGVSAPPNPISPHLPCFDKGKGSNGLWKLG